MSVRLVIQGLVVLLAGVTVLLSARRLAKHAVPRSWPEPFGRRFDGRNPVRELTWGYRLFGGGAVVLGAVWLVQGLT